MEKIPDQVEEEQKKDPQKGLTTGTFNSYAQNPSSTGWQWNKLKDFPNISQPILQLWQGGPF